MSNKIFSNIFDVIFGSSDGPVNDLRKVLAARSVMAMVLLATCASLLLLSCRNEQAEEVSVEAFTKLQEQKIPTIENLYYLPLSIEVVLNAKPEIIEEISKNNTVLPEEVGDRQLDAKEEIKKYLTRKKVYDKTSIFLEIP